MFNLWRLAIGNWLASPGRALAAILSVALGVGAIVTITNFYESARDAIQEEVMGEWMGTAHVSVFPVGAHWGSLDATIALPIAEMDNVVHVTTRLHRRCHLISAAEAEGVIESDWSWVDAIGIEPSRERYFRKLANLEGRMFDDEATGVAVIERDIALRWRLRLGDSLMITPYGGGSKAAFKVVGLFDSGRAAEFQRPNVYLPLVDLQTLKAEPYVASVIDVMLADHSAAAMKEVKAAIEQCVADRGITMTYRVETAAGRQMVLDEAERITRVTLMLVACVAMATAFFVILTTQQVSLIQRRPQLGMMRCVGLTRTQLAWLVVAELVPLGVVGTMLGVAGGIGLTFLAPLVASDLIIRVQLSGDGIGLGVASGLVTTMLSTAMLIVQVGRVSPLDAVRTHAGPVRLRYVYLAGVIGLILLVVHQLMAGVTDGSRWLDGGFAAVGTGSLYFGYVLLAPAVVVILGRPIARGVGLLLGLSGQLVEEPFIRAPWRTTGACWVLMVGLSLIVYTAVRANGVLAIWKFPSRLPGAFVWSPRHVSGDVAERVRQLPGVGETTIVADIPCEIHVPRSGLGGLRDSVFAAVVKNLTRSVLVVGDPDEMLSMIKIVFIEGVRDEAIRKLKQGGYLLIPLPASRQKNLHVGDMLSLTVRGIKAEFEVAGVVQSPALDLAVTAFQAESYMEFAAASAVLGTREDLKSKFDADIVSMVMFDPDMVSSEIAPDFNVDALPNYSDHQAIATAMLAWAPYLPNETATFATATPVLRDWLDSGASGLPPPELRQHFNRFARSIKYITGSSFTSGSTREEKWDTLRERLLLYKVADTMRRPDAIVGSLSRLKNQMVTSLKRAIIMITWLPSIILVVAAIGIANLMTVSVHLRTRQIAVLRAVGALKSQIVRLVLAEAMTIGLLGSVMGLALGFHEADSVNRIVSGMLSVSLDFIVPVTTIALAVLLTVSVCVLAAIIPARYAARNNIIDAMQTN